MLLHKGPNLTGKTIGCVVVVSFVLLVSSGQRWKGYCWVMFVISAALYPLSISLSFNFCVICLNISSHVFMQRYLSVSLLGMVVLTLRGWYEVL